MNNLQMNIAMAKLEGVEVVFRVNSKDVLLGVTSTLEVTEYNPITDLALNCMLRDKYEVDVEHYFGSASMQSAYTDRPNEFVCRFDSKQEIPRAVIICILKSKGLWV